jgi:hypothetical protein
LLTLGDAVTKAFDVQRIENRVPIEVVVRIFAEGQTLEAEETFTQDVSSRGARVVSMRRWQANDRLRLESPPGDFRATARVAYCQPLRGDGFAIGLEFLEPAGRWVIHPQPAREDR